MNSIKYPSMRKELIDYLRSLSDLNYQKRIWIDGGSDSEIQHDEFDYAIHFLYDDTELASNTDSTIGVILNNNAEASRIKNLVASIDFIFEKYGINLSDKDYVELPEWKNVIDAAGKALVEIRGNQ